MANLRYKRIILKISGESLLGSRDADIDYSVLDYISDEIKSCIELGAEIGVVIGGGNVLRGINSSSLGIDRITADYMGMLATVINSLALKDTLGKKGLKSRVVSAIQMTEVAEPLIVSKVIEYLASGEVVVFGAGTGHPYFSTDSGAALRAAEISADALIKATKVEGVYDKDPVIYHDAKIFESLDYQTVIEKRLKVMDITALTLCQDNRIPIVVYNMKKRGDLKRILLGERVGTVVS